MELMFVHVPKAGGTSVVAALKDWFGEGLLLDYSDRPIDPLGPAARDREAFLRIDHGAALAGKRAVSGHFWAAKYRDIAARRRATILRDPFDRLVSHYFYWQSTRPSPNELNSLLRRFHAERPNLEAFASWDPMRFFYSRYYFLDVDMRAFDYVGDFNDVGANWHKVLNRLAVEGSRRTENATGSLMPDYVMRKQEILADAGLRNRVRSLLSDDLRFYEKWAGPA